MARSIHSTHRDLENAHRAVYSDPARKRADICRVRDALEEKRTIKESVLEQRRSPPAHDGFAEAGAIPIRVTDRGYYIQYPAGAEDLQALMGRLPPGVLDGISEIVLELGTAEQAEFDDDPSSPHDPWTGRLGMEVLPGIYHGPLGGTRFSDAHIALYAWVYDPQNVGLRSWMFVLRLWSLSTFVHEVAHHFDHTRRVARGRWLASGEKKPESFAEQIEQSWTLQFVLPYLQQTYPQELDATQQWLEHYGGTRLRPELLDWDPGLKPFNFNMREALRALACDVASGSDLKASRLYFALQLHYCELYEPGLDVINLLLASEPDDPGALTLRGDIFVHQRRFEEAVQTVSAVLARSPSEVDALIVLADAMEGLRKFDSVVEITTRIASIASDDYLRFRAIEQRGSAFLATGMKSHAERDILTLEASGRADATAWAKGLKKKLIEAERSALDQ